MMGRAENPDGGKLAGAEKKRKSYSYVLGQGNRAWCRGKLVIQNHESRRYSIVGSGIINIDSTIAIIPFLSRT